MALSKLDTALIIVIIVMFIFAIAALIIIYKSFNTVGKRLGNAVINDIKCPGVQRCPIEFGEQKILLPTRDDLKDGFNHGVARYSGLLVARMIQSIQDKTPIILPTDVTLLKSFTLDGGKSPFCSIFESEGIRWVMCRGSIEKIDWKFDIEFNTRNYDKSAQKNIVIDIGDESGKAKIHQGFWTVYSMIIKSIKETLDDGKEYDIVVGGHSLGAAVSTLIGLDLIQSYTKKKVVVYNFASPRVGDKAFSDLLDEVKLDLYRIVNTSDLIPTLPLSVTPLVKSEKLNFYEHAGKSIEFTNNRLSLLNNHDISNYLDYLVNSLTDV